MSKQRRNLATEKAITPDFSKAIPEISVDERPKLNSAHDGPKSNPAVTTQPDLRVEAALYEAYRFQRDRANRMTQMFHESEAKFKKFRLNKALRSARGLARVSGLDQPASKGTL